MSTQSAHYVDDMAVASRVQGKVNATSTAKINLDQENKNETSLNTSSSKLASFLRYAGAGAVVLSALIYMLQGIENVDAALRQWTYLILMTSMALGGYLCRFKLGDALAARLFFALAVMLVPVQFSQLGGMVYALFNVESSSVLNDVWHFAHTDMQTVTISLVISFGLAWILSFTSFSILARFQAKKLALVFVLFNAALIIPERTTLLAVLTMAAMLLALVMLRVKLFTQHQIFSTREGLILRLIMVMPFVIACSRSSFHVDFYSGIGMMGLFLSYILIFQLPLWFSGVDAKISVARQNRLTESCLFAGVLTAVLAYAVFALGLSSAIFWFSMHLSADIIWSVVLFFPLIAILFFARRQTRNFSAFYSHLSSIACLICSWWLLNSDQIEIAAVVVLMLAIMKGAWGILLREKFPMIVGVVLGLCAIGALILTSLVGVAINVWVALAVAGIFLVLSSSVIEKYGRRWAHHAQVFWSEC